MAHVVLRAQAALPEAVASAFDAACRAEDWATLREVLRRNPSLATGRFADVLLAGTKSGPADEAQADGGWDDPDADAGTWGLRCLAGLLRRCAAVGVDRAVAAWSSPTARGGSRNLPGELSIAYAEAVLELLDRDRTPEPWSRTMHNLGTAYQQRARGRRADNLELAIACFLRALEVRTRAALPARWALTMHNLGVALTRRPTGDHGDNLEQAVVCLRAALEVFTREATPDEWAMAMDNLGTAYRQRIHGERADNLEQAIACHRQALEVSTIVTAPLDWAGTMSNLGTAYRQRIRGDHAENLEQAIACYRGALRVFGRATTAEQWATSVDGLAAASGERVRGSRAANLERSVAGHRRALKVRRAATAPLDWALSQHNLGVAYRQRSRGARVGNLDRSIEHLNLALTVHTREQLPARWAGTVHELALTYQSRGYGGRPDDLERAVALFRQALEVRTRPAAPFDWAVSRYGLGNAYRERLRGDRAEHLERGIECLTDALQVWTRVVWPERWAMTMNDLGAAYRERLRGDPAANVEQSIRYLEQALEVRTRASWPVQWAMTHNNLGAAYAQRSRGSPAENLEAAIDHYTRSLAVRTRDDLPVEWAATQHNLGVAYWLRPRGDRAENLEEAIASYRRALQVHTQEELPALWAHTCDGLGVTYRDRIAGARSRNLEAAIAWFRRALTVRDRSTLPVDWARTMNHLGAAYHVRELADRARNLERAIVSYRRALRVYSLDGMPELWAGTQHNLGNAYADRLRGEHARNLELAIGCYRNALEVHTPESMPTLCRQTCQELASAQAELGHWKDAADTYRRALEAVEILYESSLLQEARQRELAAASRLHAKAALAMVRAGRLEEAVTTLERGRARGLAEALGRPRDLAILEAARTGAPQAHAAYLAASQDVRSLEAIERRGEAGTDRTMNPPGAEAGLAEARTAEGYRRADWLALWERARAARQALRAAAERIRAIDGLGDFLSQPGFADIAAATLPGTPLAYLAATDTVSILLLVRSVGPPAAPGDRDPPASSVAVEAHLVDELTDADLRLLLVGEPAKEPDGLLVGQLAAGGEAMLEAALRVTLARLGVLTGRLANRLGKLGATGVALVPCGLLGLTPLHAARHTSDRTPAARCLMDELDVVYAPSAQVLAVARQRVTRHEGSRSLRVLAGVGDPMPSRQPLPYARLELAAAAAAARRAGFDQVHPLFTTEATRRDMLEKVRDASLLYFACHGVFDVGRPLRSHLALAGEDQLTLEELLANEYFAGARLIVASACQTAVTDFRELSDEAVGLPAGFLQAGSAGVVGTLWPVEDMAATLVMTKFIRYHLLGDPEARTGPLPPAAALRRAQCWLRDATAERLAAIFDDLQAMASNPELPSMPDGTMIELALEGSIRFGTMNPNTRPYAEQPANWASFVFVGA